MAIKRKDKQMLTYVTEPEGDEFDEAVAELEVSRADLLRQLVLEYLERRRQAAELVESSGEFEVVGDNGDTTRALGRDDVVSLG